MKVLNVRSEDVAIRPHFYFDIDPQGKEYFRPAVHFSIGDRWFSVYTEKESLESMDKAIEAAEFDLQYAYTFCYNPTTTIYKYDRPGTILIEDILARLKVHGYVHTEESDSLGKERVILG